MRREHFQSLAQLRRVHEFLERTQPSLAMGDIVTNTEQLRQSIERFTDFAVEQETRARLSRAGTSSKVQLARRLRLEYLRPVTRMSRLLFREDPALKRALTRPTCRNPEALIAATGAMADALRGKRERFVSAGFSPDFVERMELAASELKDVLDGRASDLGRRAASTAGLQDESARGLATIRLIDAMLAPRLESQPALLAEWRSLMRQGRTRPAKGRVEEGEGEEVVLTLPPVLSAMAA